MQKLLVRGYYGNGNCGDEALLQTMHQFFSPHYKLGVSVNNAANVHANLKKKNVFPYDEMDVHWSVDRGAVASPQTRGFLLGGGGLGLGFGWDQYMFAWLHGKKIIHTGVHITGEFFSNDVHFNQVTRNFLNRADFFSVRHQHSIDMAAAFGVIPQYVPDWAFALNTEDSSYARGNYIVVTVRAETNKNNPLSRKFLDSIIEFARSHDLDILLLPFDGNDKGVTESLDLPGELIDSLYFQPKQVKHIIKGAKAVFSLGRYHPIIFAMSHDVPVFSIDTIRQSRSDDKTCLQLVEEGLEDYHFPIERADSFTPDLVASLIEAYHDGTTLNKRFLSYPAEVQAAADRILHILDSQPS